MMAVTDVTRVTPQAQLKLARELEPGDIYNQQLITAIEYATADTLIVHYHNDLISAWGYDDKLLVTQAPFSIGGKAR